MKEFDHYFDFHNVVQQLIISRSKIAFYIHKHSYLDRFIPNNRFEVKDKVKRNEIETISALLPPRKEWSRPKSQSKRKEFESTIELNQQSIKNRVYQIHRLFLTGQLPFLETPLWYQNLRKFIFDLNVCVFQSDEISLTSPMIIPARKPPYDKKDIVRRPLAKFQIRDKIILSITNKYLTRIFDNIFVDASFAFRAKNSFLHGPTYNDAVSMLKDFRKKNQENALYAAECDIKKFFDCVDHEVVWSAYKRLILTLEKRNILIDKAAEGILKAYLNSYSFSGLVYPLNRNKDYWSHMNDFDGQFGWTEELIEEFEYRGFHARRIGIPQGGALSGLIVNIIMHELDLAITDMTEWNKSYIYLRYCDDMVIVHSSPEDCGRLFETYFVKLSELKLIPHEPPSLKSSYCKQFWGSKIKSRHVYFWSKNKNPRYPHSPWVSFLGYMIYHNGDLKVRKSSIEKQVQKHNNELLKVIKKLDRATNFELVNQEYSIVRSFETKLISMAVGNVDIVNYKNEPLKMCWGAGFKLIENNKFTRVQLKSLDYSMKKTVSKLKFYFQERAIENIRNEADDTLDYLEPKYPHSFFSLLDRPKHPGNN